MNAGKCRTLLMALALNVFLTIPAWGQEMMAGNVREAGPLDGKSLIVRAYSKTGENPAAFEGVVLKIEQGNVVIPAASEKVYLAVGADQDDSALAEVVGPTVRLLPAAGVWRPFPRKIDQNVMVADALGKPMPGEGMTVTLLIGAKPDAMKGFVMDQYARVQLDKLKMNAQGHVMLPAVDEQHSMTFAGYIVSHPEYGTAYVSWGSGIFPGSELCRTPLARQGTPERERALTGQIVTTTGQPVSEATIVCNNVRTPGEGLIQSAGATVISDKDGHFCIYSPGQDRRREWGDLIPPMSRYALAVKVPDRIDMLPHVGEYWNSEKARIVLRQGDAFHRFIFESAEGAILDPARDSLQVVYRTAGVSGTAPLPADKLKTGMKVPWGTYEASYHSGRSLTEFEPVTIDEHSPTEIHFKPRKSAFYTGRLVNGVNGQPMNGAFALGMSGSGRHRLAELSETEWEQLQTVANDTQLNSESFVPLRNIYSFECFVRSDPDGTWRLTPPVGQAPHSVVFFDRNFTSYKIAVHQMKPNEMGEIEVGEMKLYPAARVKVEPRVAASADKRASVIPGWVIEPEGSPEWAEPMVRKRRGAEGSFAYDTWLNDEGPSMVEVPANVKLKLKLSAPYEDEIGEVLIDREIILAQGETLDLGAVSLPENAMIAVQAIDETGAAVEGLPLRVMQAGSNTWSTAHNTDAQGVAKFFVPPGLKSVVGILVQDPETRKYNRLTVEVEATGEETVPPIYTLTVDRTFAAAAFKPRVPRN